MGRYYKQLKFSARENYPHNQNSDLQQVYILFAGRRIINAKHGAFTATLDFQCHISGYRDATSSTMSFGIQKSAGTHGALSVEDSS